MLGQKPNMLVDRWIFEQTAYIGFCYEVFKMQSFLFKTKLELEPNREKFVIIFFVLRTKMHQK